MRTEITPEAQVGELTAKSSGEKRPLRVEDLPPLSVFANTKIEYIREPELPKGSLIALVGDSGSGKSSLFSAWGRDTNIPVLVLDRENPIAVVRDRLRRIRWYEDDPRLKFWGLWHTQEAPLPDDPEIMRWVAARDPKPLIAVDGLTAFFGPGDQNDASAMREFMNRCRRPTTIGATVVVFHHDGKAETAKDFRGSSDFKAAIDLGFHVSNYGPPGLLDKITLRAFKTRIPAPPEIGYNYADGQFLRRERFETKQADMEPLRALLRLNPGVTGTQFDALVKNSRLGRDRGRRFLAEGVDAGTIRCETGAKNEKRHWLLEGSAQPGIHLEK